MEDIFAYLKRLKKKQYSGNHGNYYFWRTYDQKEIDLIEEEGGRLRGFEFKWTEKAVKIPQEFLNTYPGSTFNVVHKENYLEFVK